MQNYSDDARNALWHLIKDIKFGMFTTMHAQGYLHSCPMTTQNKSIDEHNVLWFFMSRKSDTVSDISQNETVGIAYADPGEDTYVSVSGKAEVVEDKARANELWSVFAKAWFPGGVDDPDLALVKVTINHAHFWDVKASKIVQLFQIAKAAVVGEPPKFWGEGGEIKLSSPK